MMQPVLRERSALSYLAEHPEATDFTGWVALTNECFRPSEPPNPPPLALWLPRSGGEATGERFSFSSQAADAAVRRGVRASLVEELASACRRSQRDLYEYLGLDRTTVRRRVDKGLDLPADTAARLLMLVQLVGRAAEVFGTVRDGVEWLTAPHPMLADATPLQYARTPWGAQKVDSVLVAIRYGGVA